MPLGKRQWNYEGKIMGYYARKLKSPRQATSSSSSASKSFSDIPTSNLPSTSSWKDTHKDLIASLEEHSSDSTSHYLPLAHYILDSLNRKGSLTEQQLAFVQARLERSSTLIPKFDYDLHSFIHENLMFLPPGQDSQFYRDVTKYSMISYRGKQPMYGYGLTERQHQVLWQIYNKYGHSLYQQLLKYKDKTNNAPNSELARLLEHFEDYKSDQDE